MNKYLNRNKDVIYNMPNYQDGKIYRMTCNKTGLGYVGSTCSTLSQRLYNHAFKWEAWKQQKANNCGSFKIIEGGDYKIELVEEYPSNSKTELLKRERYWFDLEKEKVTLCNLFLPYRFYADLQEQRRKTDAKRATNPDRIASRQSSNRKRYLLKKELTFYNIQE